MITQAYAFVTKQLLLLTSEAVRLSAENKYDASPALPDSVPDSSEFSPDSEDEVRAGIERKRIW